MDVRLVVYVLQCLEIHAVASVEMNGWKRHPNYTDLAPTNGELWTKLARSRLHCVVQCSNDVMCETTFFDKQTKICKGMKKELLGITDLTQSPNTSFYYFGNVCDVGYSLWNGSCYKLIRTSGVNHATAQNRCIETGGYLARIDNEEEKNSIVGTLNKYIDSSRHRGLWIDGGDDNIEGFYRFSDLRNMTFLPWSQNEPTGKNEDCIELYLDNGRINDLGCHIHKVMILCERNN